MSSLANRLAYAGESAAAAAAAGWSISGPDAAGLSVASGSGIRPSSPSTVLTLALDGRLPDTAPDIVLSYDAPAAGEAGGHRIVDRAGNALPGGSGSTVADRMAPNIASSLISGSGRVEIRYTEPVDALPGAYSGLVLDGVPRSIDEVAGGDARPGHACARIQPTRCAGRRRHRHDKPDGGARQGRRAEPLGGPGGVDRGIHDGRVLQVASSRIAGPDTAVVEYTRPAPAQPGRLRVCVVVDGLPRNITGLSGGGGGDGGTRLHTLTFAPGGAPPSATGSVAIDMPGLFGRQHPHAGAGRRPGSRNTQAPRPSLEQ